MSSHPYQKKYQLATYLIFMLQRITEIIGLQPRSVFVSLHSNRKHTESGVPLTNELVYIPFLQWMEIKL